MKTTRSDIYRAAFQTLFKKIHWTLPKSRPQRGILGERGNAPLPWGWKEVNSLGAIFFPADNHTAPI